MPEVLMPYQQAEKLLARLYPMCKVKLTTLTAARMMKMATPREINFLYEIIVRGGIDYEREFRERDAENKKKLKGELLWKNLK